MKKYKEVANVSTDKKDTSPFAIIKNKIFYLMNKVMPEFKPVDGKLKSDSVEIQLNNDDNGNADNTLSFENIIDDDSSAESSDSCNNIKSDSSDNSASSESVVNDQKSTFNKVKHALSQNIEIKPLKTSADHIKTLQNVIALETIHAAQGQNTYWEGGRSKVQVDTTKTPIINEKTHEHYEAKIYEASVPEGIVSIAEFFTKASQANKPDSKEKVSDIDVLFKSYNIAKEKYASGSGLFSQRSAKTYSFYRTIVKETVQTFINELKRIEDVIVETFQDKRPTNYQSKEHNYREIYWKASKDKAPEKKFVPATGEKILQIIKASNSTNVQQSFERIRQICNQEGNWAYEVKKGDEYETKNFKQSIEAILDKTTPIEEPQIKPISGLQRKI